MLTKLEQDVVDAALKGELTDVYHEPMNDHPARYGKQLSEVDVSDTWFDLLRRKVLVDDQGSFGQGPKITRGDGE